MGGPTTTVVLPSGRVVEAPAEAVEQGTGFGREATPEEAAAARDRAAAEKRYGGILGGAQAGAESLLSGATGGAYDVLGRMKYGEDFAKERRAQEEARPLVTTTAELAGSIVGPIKGTSKIAGSIAKKAGGGVLGAAVGAGAEGGIVGFGAGAKELALSESPLTIEQMVSTLSSRAAFGAVVGAPVGALAKAAERGLVRAKGAVDDMAARAKKGATVSDDIASLDHKGLRAAEETERAALEASRVPERAKLADDILALQKESKGSKFWLATEEKSLRAVALKADKRLTSLSDNIKGLSQSPKRALDALQRKEQVLEQIVAEGSTLRAQAKAAADMGQEFAGSQTKLKALDAAEDMLSKNKALQQRITALEEPLASPRLQEISDARDLLQTGGSKKKGLVDQMVQGSAYGAVMGALPAMPLGGVVAPFIAAKASNFLSDLVTGRLASASAETAARSADTIKKFLDVGTKVTKAAPPLATRVLSNVSYAPRREEDRDAKPQRTLAGAYKARESELLDQTVPGPTGMPVMRPEKRRSLSDGILAGVRAASPELADRMETVIARRVEFLASKLPKRPDYLALQFGPDKWQPSDMEMRAFARYAAAVEDPGGVEERLISGQVTPEDAEAYQTVYPERFADFKRQIVENLPSLRASLPYERQVALSIFTGIPVDPAMRPQTVARLQASFLSEAGTDGGMQAPRARPQFGSVTNPEMKGTPSQERAQ